MPVSPTRLTRRGGGSVQSSCLNQVNEEQARKFVLSVELGEDRYGYKEAVSVKTELALWSVGDRMRCLAAVGVFLQLEYS